MQHLGQAPGAIQQVGTQTGSFALLDGTRHFCLNLDQPMPPGVDLVALPAGLERAVARRQVQFRAGRYCAMRALEALDPQFARREIERSATGAPAWPMGLTGSITHTDDFAAAVVARTTNALSIGIDTERVMSNQQAHDVGHVIASPTELSYGRVAGITPREMLTLVFSAKESIFKCLHPLVGRMFEFHDVCLVGVTVATQTFQAEILKTLGSGFSAGTLLKGRFAIDGQRIHTGLLLEIPEARRRCEAQAPLQVC